MKTIIVLMFVSMLLACGCSQSTQLHNPVWVDELIAKFQSDPVGYPPQSIYRYEYNGQTVYYVPPQCCDQYSTLYDINGNIICAPDGGLTGNGDGQCPDFFYESADGILIWNDSRTR